ncbi:MAG: 2-isopropylmalate synthase [Chloroflexi bacterium]|nr:MAG: 2-isopropylmalate synthase [Chloroflexota bacterium]
MAESPPVVLYDTLLRDGSQMEGIAFSLDDKVAIAHRLDALGVHYVEGGFPGSNEKDKAFFERMQERPLAHAKLVAFGGTRKPGSDTASDFNMQALLGAETPVVTLVGKASAYQVRVALGTSQEENLSMIRESVSHIRAQDREVHFDAEHFFDGFREDADYALQALRTAARAGAQYLVLCDTNGGAMTTDLRRAIAAVRAALPDVALGIHCHDDCGLAVGNSLAAVEAGVTQVQGCVNGYGERCGNANLSTVVANLQLKMDRRVVSDTQLAELTNTSLFVAELANLPLNGQAPYVGASAFAHKAGYHVAAIVKDPDTYQHIDPDVVGNGRRILVSELSGQRNISVKLAERGLDLPLSKEENRALLDRVKQMESRGFQYEGAEASFELLALRLRADYQPPFDLEDFLIVNRRRHQDDGDPTTHSDMQAEAMTKIAVGEEIFQTAADGNGPVSAMDASIRRGLTQPYPAIATVHLRDYKVRILDSAGGAEAGVRVLIESSDGEHIWHTVGSSTDVIEASWIALSDAYEYFLYKQPQWSAE